MTKRKIITPRPSPEEQWERLSDEVTRRGGDGEDFVSAMKELYSVMDNRVLLWLSTLYDPNIGGFYYSPSARDNEGFLPDIESTLQALCIIGKTGMIDSAKELPKAMRKKIAEFVISCQDPDDGFFYHPQWGKAISKARRGRDLEWAIDLSKRLGFRLPYPTANAKAKQNAAMKNTDILKAKKLPTHFVSPDAFRTYLRELPWDKSPEGCGSELVAQALHIKAAGFSDIAVDFLNSIQDSVTGMWGKEDPYQSVITFMKISGLYVVLGKPFHHSLKAALTAISALTSEVTPPTACSQYDVWFALRNIMINLRTHLFVQGEKKVEIIGERLLCAAPEAIRATKRKALLFKRADGSFSYNQKGSSWYSQGCTVAVRGAVEGDVNASVALTQETLDKIYRATELYDFAVDLFTKEDYEMFLDSLSL